MSNEQQMGREIREWRRLRAVQLDRMGWLEVEIATVLGVNKGTVSRWLAVAEAHGADASPTGAPATPARPREGRAFTQPAITFLGRPNGPPFFCQTAEPKGVWIAACRSMPA